MQLPFHCWRFGFLASGALTLTVDGTRLEPRGSTPVWEALQQLEQDTVRLEQAITELSSAAPSLRTHLKQALIADQERLGEALGRFWSSAFPGLQPHLRQLDPQGIVRVALALERPEARALPWEMLRWPVSSPNGRARQTWVGTDPRFTLIRLVSSAAAHAWNEPVSLEKTTAPPTRSPGRIPPGTVTLVSTEPVQHQTHPTPFAHAFLAMTAGALEGLAPLLQAGRLHVCSPPLPELDAALRQSDRPLIFHWFGHGQVLRLQTQTQQQARSFRSLIPHPNAPDDVYAVTPEVHVGLFAPEKIPALAVLMTCFGAGDSETGEHSQAEQTLAAAFLQEQVPAVIASRGQLSFSGAEVFSSCLYAQLGQVTALDVAMQAARKAAQQAAQPVEQADTPDAWWRLNLMIQRFSALDWGAAVAGEPGDADGPMPRPLLEPPLPVLLAGIARTPEAPEAWTDLISSLRKQPVLSARAPMQLHLCTGTHTEDLLSQLQHRLDTRPAVVILIWPEQEADDTPTPPALIAHALPASIAQMLQTCMGRAPFFILLHAGTLPTERVSELRKGPMRGICLTGAPLAEHAGSVSRILEQLAQGTWLHEAWDILQPSAALEESGLPWGELPLFFGDPSFPALPPGGHSAAQVERFGTGWCTPLVKPQTGVETQTQPHALRWIRAGALGAHPRGVAVIRAFTLARLREALRTQHALLEGDPGSGRRFLLTQLIEQLCAEGLLHPERIQALEWHCDEATRDAALRRVCPAQKTQAMSLLIFLPARGPQQRAEAGSRRRPSPQAAFERWLLQAQECFPQLRMVGITEPGRSDPLPGPCARLTLLPISPDASRHLALELPLLSSVLRLRDPADPCWRALNACTRGNIGATVQLEWQLRSRLTGEHPQSRAGRGDFSLFPSSWPWYDGLVPLSPPPDARAHLEALLQPDFHREQRTSAQVNGARDRTRKEPPA